MAFHKLIFIVFVLVIAACGDDQQSLLTPIQKTFPTPTATPLHVSFTPTVISIPQLASPTPFICDGDWQSLSVIPDVAESARILYRQGLAEGNNSLAFSKIGDGEISTDWFLTAFDLDEAHYDLAEHQDLRNVIEIFHGSFGRHSMAAQRGFNTNLILDSAASDPTLCNASESPLDCELRIHNPSIAILSLGTNQVHRPDEFEKGLRSILEILLARHVLPILSTKGDNLEGDHRINRTIACLAQEYQLPLWNLWAAIQTLPNHGLQSDLEHLTYSGRNDFDDPVAMQSAWTVRNLTALQVLDEVWESLHR